MIEINNVTFGYRRGKALYEHLNVKLVPGSIYGLLGPNGVGKSTLLRLMAGLLYPKWGTIRAGDYVPAERKPAFLEDVFLVPEEFYLPPVRIRQFIESNALFYPRFDRIQMAGYVREFGLTDSQKLSELSYGQKKKILIGFALATNTALLLMDEPTNGLDIPSKGQFRRLVAGAVDDRRTVVISTHQVRDLETLIDPIVILNQYGVVLNAPVEEITTRLWFGMVPGHERPGHERPGHERPGHDEPGHERPGHERPGHERPGHERPGHDEPELDSNRSILYSERVVGGYAVVTQNPALEPSRLDLERLFNAVQAEPDRIRQLFSSTSTYANA